VTPINADGLSCSSPPSRALELPSLYFCASSIARSRAEAVSSCTRSVLFLALRTLSGPPKRCARFVGGEAGHKRILSSQSVIDWTLYLVPSMLPRAKRPYCSIGGDNDLDDPNSGGNLRRSRNQRLPSG
jgi:hypothetical protein